LAAFALWVLANFALTLGATLAIVNRAVSLPADERLTNRFLVVWALEWGGPMVVACVLGGLFVFKRSTPWRTLLTWPWLVGVVVGLAYLVGLSGQMDSGSRLCDAPPNSSCDDAWGARCVAPRLRRSGGAGRHLHRVGDSRTGPRPSAGTRAAVSLGGRTSGRTVHRICYSALSLTLGRATSRDE
jgi:hypothetical protein